MAVEYDLVIIGSTEEAIYAALKAVYLKARVALVLQVFPGQIGANQAIFSRICNYLRPVLPSDIPIFFPNTKSWDIHEVKCWLNGIVSIKKEQNSLAVLASLGVDLIEGNGEFCRLPQLAFLVNQRRLRSRAYLIATGVSSQVPNILGIQETGYLTISDIFAEDKLLFLPKNLTIIGGNPESLPLAQSLARLGKNITLIVENKSILPKEDRDVSRLIQGQLEAEGIRLITNVKVSQVKRIEVKKWVQAGNKAIETDEILIAAKYQPNIKDLNLPGVGVLLSNQGILVNKKLQTKNKKIYACGSVLGGYNLANIAQYEADTVLKNALFFPLFKVKYNQIPCYILTEPNLARIGLTETKAREYFAGNIIIVQRYFKEIIQPYILGKTTGFCKIILTDSGKILGVHIVGAEAGELIGVFALAMQQNIKISQLGKTYFPSLTFAEIINQCISEWQKQSWNRNKNLSNFLNTWYNWQKNNNS